MKFLIREYYFYEYYFYNAKLPNLQYNLGRHYIEMYHRGIVTVTVLSYVISINKQLWNKFVINHFELNVLYIHWCDINFTYRRYTSTSFISLALKQ